MKRLTLLCLALTTPALAAPKTYHIDFRQAFAQTPCPANAPAGRVCLHVTGQATHGVSFDRTVQFDPKLFDGAHPTCIPDETEGTATLPNGTLTFRAPGSVCLADGTAAYALIVTGGTGALAHAVGGGRITVAPPTGESTGREIWQFELD